MESCFHIGDRVVAVVDHPDNNECIVCGSTGTVRSIDEPRESVIGVEWDMDVNGHGLSDEYGEDRCKYGYGWNVESDDIEVCTPDNDEEITVDEEFLQLIGLS